MAKKQTSKKTETLDHQQEHPDDPVLVPDFRKIQKFQSNEALELVGGDSVHEYSDIFETICGATDDSQPVEQYDGTLGVTQAFVNAHEKPVCEMRWNSNLNAIYDNPGNVAGVRWCTGTLISNNLMLTAGHCFDQTGGTWQRPRINGTNNIISPEEIATNMHVEFNYQARPDGTLRNPVVVEIEELIEYRLGGLDFAIARLAGSPGTQWGVTRMADDDGTVGDMICIIGHPAGQPKRIEAGPITAFQDDRVRYNDIDTLGGNSGSGILRASDGCIVGIHTNGGCNASMTGSNFGAKITAIRRESPTIRSIAAHTNTISDRINTLAQIDTNNLADQLTFAQRDSNIVSDRITNTRRDSNTLSDRITNLIQDRVTNVFADSRGTFPPVFDQRGSALKALDDRKATGLDKLMSDRKIPGADNLTGRLGGLGGLGNPLNTRIQGGEQPFVLSTPHHATNFDQNEPYSTDDETAQAYEEALLEIENAINDTTNQLQHLQAEYEAIAAEYSSAFDQ